MKKIYRLLYSNKFVAMVMLLMQIITFVAMYIWISDYSKVLFGLSTVLSAVLIIFEINRTEESTFKMTWITLIAIIPIFGALFYLFTRAQGVSMNIGDDYKNIQEANKKYLVQDNDVMKNIYQTDKNQDGFARYLSKYGGSPAYTNTGVQYYSIGERMFEDMKKNNPRRYRVAGLGEWGISEGLVFENWEEKDFSIDELKGEKCFETVFGLDFGYTNDPTALFCGFINTEKKEIYVFDELYKKGMSNEAIYEAVVEMGYKKEKIRADSAEPKSIDRLRTLGLKGIRPARKGKDSINNGIDFLQDYKIYISPKCQNFITEISNYTWDKDLNGKMLNRPVDSFNHLMDAMRYAVEEISNGEIFSFE